MFLSNCLPPSDDDITEYFASGTPASGLTVFDSIENLTEIISDLSVENGTAYYYKALIRDTDTPENSSALAANGTPVFTGTTNVVNSKDVVIEGIKRILRNYSSLDFRDYEVKKSYSFLPPKITPSIAVVRQGSNDVQRFWGNVYNDEAANKQYGKIDQDNLLVIWADVISERRDTLTDIFRAHEATLRKYVIQETNAIDFKLQIGSDDIDMRYESAELHTCQMLIQIVYPAYMQHAEQERRLGLDDVSHEGVF